MTTVKDLGLPTLVGVILGALINHLTAKARGREEHERGMDRMVLQDQRQVALATLQATSAIRVQVASGDANWGALHNEWQDLVLSPTRLIRDDELDVRIRGLGYLLAMGSFAREEHFDFAAIEGCGDVEACLEAWLRREPFPPRALPTMEEMRGMILAKNSFSADALNDWLAKRLAGG